MDLLSLIAEVVNVAFPDNKFYTPTNRSAITNFLLTTPVPGDSSGQTIAQYFYSELTGSNAALPDGYGYIFWAGTGSLARRIHEGFH